VDPYFTNLEGTAHASLPLQIGFGLDVTARGKTGFGHAQYLSEQLALDAPNGVSSYPSGSFDVDSGATLRAEFSYNALSLGRSLAVTPYVYGAGGWGWLANPTAVQQGYISAASAGLGSRFRLDSVLGLKTSGVTINLELGHQFSNIAERSNGDRVSVLAAAPF
jgi:hemolysin activation/secretion protein